MAGLLGHGGHVKGKDAFSVCSWYLLMFFACFGWVQHRPRSVSCVLSHIIHTIYEVGANIKLLSVHTTPLWGGYYYKIHFTNEEPLKFMDEASKAAEPGFKLDLFTFPTWTLHRAALSKEIGWKGLESEASRKKTPLLDQPLSCPGKVRPGESHSSWSRAGEQSQGLDSVFPDSRPVVGHLSGSLQTFVCWRWERYLPIGERAEHSLLEKDTRLLSRSSSVPYLPRCSRLCLTSWRSEQENSTCKVITEIDPSF